MSCFQSQPISGQYNAIIHKRVVRQVTSDYKIYVYEWDNVNSSINTSLHDDRADYRQNVAQRIKWDIARFKKIIDDFKMKNLEYTADEIIEIFNQKSQHLSFFKYMQGIINRLRQLNKRGTADNYQYTLQSFSAFNGNSDLQFEEITISLIEEYEAWLSTNGVKPNSSSFYIRNLRAVYNRAVEDNLIEDTHPFRKAFTGVTKTAKRAISLNDIKKIKALDLSFNEQLQFSRDIFLFQFYCMGISFIDVAFLKLANIVGNIISYRRHKTNQEIIVPINEQIKEIINRYRNNGREYLFPIIDEKCDSLRTQYRLALRRMNNNLKKIATLANLEINLTTYVTRHSWASIAKNKGVSVAIISDALGHDSIQTTEIYLSTISTAELRKANKKVLEGL